MARILVVEDSRTQAAELRWLLEDAGHDVEIARDGELGLQLVRQMPFDLVISDVIMPKLDGLGLCRAIRQDAGLRHLPLLLLTGRNSPEDILEGFLRGVDSFLAKPVEPEQLLPRVARLLKPRAEGGAATRVPLRYRDREVVIEATCERMVEMLVATFEEVVSLSETLEAVRERGD